MDRRTAQRCIELLAASRGTVRTLDLTGGAPELNSHFRSACLLLNNTLSLKRQDQRGREYPELDLAR